MWAARRETLLAAFAETKPDALVIEAYPFGRRAFRRELEPLVAAATREQTPAPSSSVHYATSSLPRPTKSACDEIVARVRADFDAFLVHGDPRLIGLEASFARASEIADRLIYTGYVTSPQTAIDAEETAGAGEVLVSAGGGAVGGALLRAALGARRLGYLADARLASACGA